MAPKQGSIAGNYFPFIRGKIKKTKKERPAPITVGPNLRAREIIKRWSYTDPANPDLFPIFEKDLTPLTIKYRCQCFTKWVNNHMDEIRKELKIDQKVS